MTPAATANRALTLVETSPDSKTAVVDKVPDAPVETPTSYDVLDHLAMARPSRRLDHRLLRKLSGQSNFIHHARLSVPWRVRSINPIVKHNLLISLAYLYNLAHLSQPLEPPLVWQVE